MTRQATKAKMGRATATEPKRGRPMNLYLHPEDEQKIRTLSGWLAGKGHRVSDSQVVKAALRCAEANAELLEAYQSTIASDRRYKRES